MGVKEYLISVMAPGNEVWMYAFKGDVDKLAKALQKQLPKFWTKSTVGSL